MTLHTVNVSNPTLQNWTVPYRIGAPGSPELGILRQFFLPSGTQIDVGPFRDDIDKAQFIAQLEIHGARDASDVHGRLVGFHGLIYRDSGEITVTEIEQAHEAEMETRQERSVRQATRAALGFDKAARQPSNRRPPARITETTLAQELPRGVRPSGKEVSMNLTVDPEGRSDVDLPV